MTNELLIHKNSCFSAGTFIPNSLFQDETLTWAARGLLGYMLSLPPDWVLNENHLVKMAPSSRDHLRSLVKELEQNGYLRRTQVRGAAGRLSRSYWEVWDTKQELQPRMDSPLTDFPSTVEPSPVEPSPEKPSAYIYNNKQINLNPRTPLNPPVGGEAPQAAPNGWASPGQLAQQPGQQPQPAQVPAAITSPSSSALVVHPVEVLPPAGSASIDPAAAIWPQEAQQGASIAPAAHSPAEQPAGPSARPAAPDPDRSGAETPKPRKPIKPRDPFSSRQLPPGSIPDNLLDCQQLLAEWWEVKSRGRTENAFRRACAFLSEQPPSDRRQILNNSVIGGFQGLYPLSPQAKRQQHGSGYSPLDTARRATEMISRMQAAMAEDGDNNPTTFFS